MRTRILVLSRKGFTLMEVLVVIAIIVVIAALSWPFIEKSQRKANELETSRRMKDLAAATSLYLGANNDELPREDAQGTDTWPAAADPENVDAWYNALPKLLDKRRVIDFVDSPQAFYTKENPLYVPGAAYPTEPKRIRRPLFAIAINSKLQRRNPETKKKPILKLDMIENKSRTPLFLEQGLPGEKKEGGLAVQQKSDYDGSPKGSAKSFVGRHSGFGHILFVDGHIEKYEPQELLTASGDIPYPPSKSRLGLIWCHTSEEDPNQ